MPSAPFRAMVHHDVRDNPLEAIRHQSFIASRLIGGGAAFVAFPAYLALWGAPNLMVALVFAWLMSPIAIALFLSRTGRFEAAQALSALSFTGLITFVAAMTGGVHSAFLPWIVAVPAEAALSGSRRVVLASTGLAVAAVAGLAAVMALGGLPEAAAVPLPGWALSFIGAVPAALYVGVLGVRLGTLRSDAKGVAVEPFKALAENAADLITRHRRNGNVTVASAASDTMLGVPAPDLLQDGLFRRIHVADRPTYMKALDDAAMGKPCDVELRVRGAEDRGFVWVEMRCRALPADAGEACDVVAVIRPIGPRKAQEAELLAAFEDAERTSLAKSRFLARMSHELRTPLNAVIGFSEILAQEMLGKLGQDKHREYAEVIRDSGRHLLDLINDILDMSKIEAGNFEIFPEPFDLPALIGTCRQMLEPQSRAAELTIETDLAVNLPELMADRRACKQILLNLLNNAVKFSRKGGRVVVGAYLEGECACLYVADEGIGIASDDLRRLGQPFVQVHSSYDRSYEGTGLGLSVVKGLVELHGGSMEIESRLGVGTRVTIRLPVDAVVERTEVTVEPVEMMRLSA